MTKMTVKNLFKEKSSDITIEQFFDYVKKSDLEKFDDPFSWDTGTLYYLKKFKKYGFGKFYFSWNWCGFFSVPCWAAYRKMYALAALTFSIDILIGFANNYFMSDETEALSVHNLMMLTFLFILNGLLASICNTTYFTHIKHRIDNPNIVKGVSLPMCAIFSLAVATEYYYDIFRNDELNTFLHMIFD